MVPSHARWLLLLVAACGSSSSRPPDASSEPPIDAPPPDAPDFDDPDQVEVRLDRTLEALAGFGNKRAGTPAGRAAGDWLLGAFEEAGLDDVHFESFTFPAFTIVDSSLQVTVGGDPIALGGHDVLAYSGAGTATGEVIHVGTGHEEDYAGVDATGKIVMVDRDAVFHRQAQYALVIAHGGAAMLFASASPNNQPQIGTVTDPEDGLGPILALTIGMDDAAAIAAALDLGASVQASATVEATVAPATGRNVVGFLPGTDPGGGYFLVGAHYDTWYEGAVDNASGVAAIRELARAMAAGGPRRFGLVFVGFDAEELGLFGGYDFLRDHVIVGGEPALGFLNFEMPSAEGNGIKAVAYTETTALIDPLMGAAVDQHYPYFVGMEIVPQYFGGLIPTDIQGMYWYGLHGTTTFCETPYYHTPQDTRDRVDLGFLADAVLRFEEVLDALDAADPAPLAVRDPYLWSAEVTTTAVAGGLEVTIAATTSTGNPAVGGQVTVWVDVDDFTRAFRTTAVTDDAGTAQVVIPDAALGAGSGGRWLHVNAGQTYPLVEAIQPLP